jgi:large subunit ribosomal protein L21
MINRLSILLLGSGQRLSKGEFSLPVRQLSRTIPMSAYAIIEAGGTQIRVEPGRFYDINRLASEPNAEITIDRVLLVSNAGEVTIGQPIVAGATVTGTIVSHLRGRKIIVYKMQPKKKTRKKQGHRQDLTRVMIDSISLDGTVIDSKDQPRG